MAFEIPKIRYTGTIKEVTLGTGEKAVKVGGEGCYPFYTFEGDMPNPPRVAFEVWDCQPDDWQEWAVEPFRDVLHDPVLWAKKCIDVYGAELIALQLKSADPNGMNRDVEDVIEVVKKISDAVDCPLIVWGTSNDDKDAVLLRRVAEVCEGKNIAVGPVSEKNYKQIGAMSIGYGQVVMASTPIDVNLAKQLNILLGNLGIQDEKIIMDPTSGSLGYGLEYTYSVMERDRMAALTQEDTKLQYPIICNVAQEVWKTKETRLTEQEEPRLGNEVKRSILMESITAMSLLLAGADIVIMRHPEAVRLIKEIIGELMAK
ncbi:MAG TPA: acetyl-CoA decarbonylase/synthase complex subunit delta [Syntrophorhabdaceae bacterium]|nr:acetyl-CoA decarbonylase/synthase complex subunit delta [Syntrophorhabdaceae bacterium]HPC66249.1 acetyl-CoA decarbonylase/synthase complex subunit delta [Syntrophorhabdaceae bacterium]HQK45646.1 acetyl-CoA decarbonylase/synthase complex subunit delta [Syntrophorhabdaceae bacterium]HRR70801.1 acetyl-CoA decarbonylase/synthase complex subunit delta [Syntrophorhabdaceae bacterium]